MDRIGLLYYHFAADCPFGGNFLITVNYSGSCPSFSTSTTGSVTLGTHKRCFLDERAPAERQQPCKSPIF